MILKLSEPFLRYRLTHCCWRLKSGGSEKVNSVEEAEDFATDMLSTGLFVIHDALVGSQDESAELTGWKDSVREVLEVSELEIEVGGDHSALVESSVEVDADLSTTGIIDDLELTNVTVSLHNLEELDEGLG